MANIQPHTNRIRSAANKYDISFDDLYRQVQRLAEPYLMIYPVEIEELIARVVGAPTLSDAQAINMIEVDKAHDPRRYAWDDRMTERGE